MKLLHKLAHWFSFNSTFTNMYADENGDICICTQCNTCGKKENIKKLWTSGDNEHHLKMMKDFMRMSGDIK